jgi:hypothetical protein
MNRLSLPLKPFPRWKARLAQRRRPALPAPRRLQPAWTALDRPVCHVITHRQPDWSKN